MAAVTIHNLSKAYGTHSVIPNADIEIEDGEFVVLVGPSGCGKSTLLRMIAGLEEITGGEIRIDGRRINEVEPKERDIAMVFQSYALYPHMTVEENMAFSLRLKKTARDEIERRVSRAADILGLNDLLNRYPRQLSGGQRQRVAMGRAIVRDPKVFLFDEPLSNLDAKLRVQMRTEIRELHQRLKTTTVYVTHDQMEAMTMADKIVVMRAGIIEQIGSPLEVYDRPASLFVAGFIGSPSMNFLPCVTTEGGLTIKGGPRLPFDVGCEPGRAVTLGIRPEHLRASNDDEPGVEMIVEVVEPTGPEFHVLGRIANHPVMMSIRERRQLLPGETIRVCLERDRCHLFDRRTESVLEAD